MQQNQGAHFTSAPFMCNKGRVAAHFLLLRAGAVLSRNDITTRLDAEGCDVVLNGLYMADGRQHGTTIRASITPSRGA